VGVAGMKIRKRKDGYLYGEGCGVGRQGLEGGVSSSPSRPSLTLRKRRLGFNGALNPKDPTLVSS